MTSQVEKLCQNCDNVGQKNPKVYKNVVSVPFSVDLGFRWTRAVHDGGTTWQLEASDARSPPPP